jgi:hypothetical protein
MTCLDCKKVVEFSEMVLVRNGMVPGPSGIKRYDTFCKGCMNKPPIDRTSK